MSETLPTRLIVGITGATGTIFGVRLLQMLQGSGIETHLVMSKWGGRTLLHETRYSLEEVQQMASCYYSSGDQGAAIAGGPAALARRGHAGPRPRLRGGRPGRRLGHAAGSTG